MLPAMTGPLSTGDWKTVKTWQRGQASPSFWELSIFLELGANTILESLPCLTNEGERIEQKLASISQLHQHAHQRVQTMSRSSVWLGVVSSPSFPSLKSSPSSPNYFPEHLTFLITSATSLLPHFFMSVSSLHQLMQAQSRMCSAVVEW